MVLAYNCLEVAAKLGHYHRAVRRLQPGEELPDWIPTPEVLARDPKLDYMDAFTLLGDTMHPAFGHPKMLARAYDHVYYEGRDGEPTTEREEVRRPVCDSVPGRVHPDCTLALHADTDRLWEVCPTYADIASAPGNGLPKQEVWGILLEGSGVWTSGAVWTSEQLQDGWTPTKNQPEAQRWGSCLSQRWCGCRPQLKRIPSTGGVCGGAGLGSQPDPPKNMFPRVPWRLE